MYIESSMEQAAKLISSRINCGPSSGITWTDVTGVGEERFCWQECIDSAYVGTTKKAHRSEIASIGLRNLESGDVSDDRRERALALVWVFLPAAPAIP